MSKEREEKKGDSSTETATTAAVQLQQSTRSRIVELVRERSNAEEWGAWLQVPLHHAAAVGDKGLTRELMFAGASGDPLLAAVKGGQHDLVEHLLQGQSPRTCDKQGSQAIHHAARLGHELVVSLLLKHGVEVDSFDWSGLTPLDLAAREGRVGVVEVLLDAGADARNRGDLGDERLPLEMAFEGGHAGVISVFTRRDPAIINDIDYATGFAALHIAAKHNQVGSIDALVEAGADLELQDRKKGCTALHIAAAFPDCEAAVLALLRHGADKETPDIDGLTPLLMAVKKGHEASAMALIAAGADCSGGENHSPLELAVQGRCVALMRVLIENGANANDARFSGYTPLHWAGWFDHGPAVDFLVESGANLEAKIDNGESTPLHAASQNAGNLEAIAALVRHGANIHARKVPSGNTPLHVAASNHDCEGSPGTVDALLKAGADETVVNADGHTPADLLEKAADELGWSEYTYLISALLTNAPRDRADRRWARRRLFVLCHAFSDRVRLASSEGNIGGRWPSCFSVNDPTTGNHEEAGSTPSDGTIGISRDFSVAMGRLIGLQADVFRTVVEFL